MLRFDSKRKLPKLGVEGFLRTPSKFRMGVTETEHRNE